MTDEDHHSDILEAEGIRDDKLEPDFVKFELLPKDNDPFSDIATWRYVKDQDVDPDWYVEEIDSKRAIEQVKEWAKNRIFIGVCDLEIEEGKNYYLKDCEGVSVRGGTIQRVRGGTIQDVWGGTIQRASGNSVIRSGRGSGYHKPETLVLCENALFIDTEEKTIYQGGDWKLVSVESRWPNGISGL